MPKGFWGELKKPIFANAPMANITDAAFRRMFADIRHQANIGTLRNFPGLRNRSDCFGGVGSKKGCGYAGPDVFWTEFVSIEALLSKGKDRALIDLRYDADEHPIVAQIFGVKPEQFEVAARIVRKLGFDGVDINMGCPDNSVERQGAGAAFIKKPDDARKVIRAVKRGADELPVSVKTRIGYAKNEIETWLPTILKENIAALTVHLRTRNEMSDVPAHWDLAPEIVALRDKYAPGTLVLGNGDIFSMDDAHAKVAVSGMDGAMIGRGIFGNPWFFTGHEPSVGERLNRMVIHAETFEKMYLSDQPKNSLKGFDVMKKHFKAYCSGFNGAKELRIQLMETKNAAEVKKIVQEFKTQNPHLLI